MLKVGVKRMRQSTGLNAPSPWKRSIESEKKSWTNRVFGLPKNSDWKGFFVLSNGGVAIGNCRASMILRREPVSSRKVFCPTIG